MGENPPEKCKKKKGNFKVPSTGLGGKLIRRIINGKESLKFKRNSPFGKK